MTRLWTPDVGDGRIEVLRLDFDLEAPWPDADWDVLTAEERERALRFLRHEDRLRMISTRAALRRLLGERLGVDPSTLRFTAGRYGRPELAGGVSFNVSHSGDFALIAISQRWAVGVDIEQVRETSDLAGLASLALTAEEHEGIDAAGFFARWTAKEAALKALGLGIVEKLQAFSVWPGLGDLYELRHAEADWGDLRAARLEAPSGYAAALAWKSP
ncbi:4'-phosphopantetheinyl transferase superfamily protein [Methylosinus sp. H3A]|uniref:4'-phosphopantetheinyl transferase family protein n=1 Tax=Methylosinus sp. H3A TaxID=2785786 RepID=UPI0018C2A618|nr:4'-phosphopantetheinyl transferase superfamily protein [Methylosinus sp. H3A]MBG0811069.1 4'-phosphopantetheinyl transferase superfamily protein [Methylosinus sp. H3A]